MGFRLTFFVISYTLAIAILTPQESWAATDPVVCNKDLAVLKSGDPIIPDTTYKAEIRPADDSIWIMIPPKDATTTQPTELFIGTLSTIKAGTTFYHWGSDQDIARLDQDKGISPANFTQRLLNPSSEDLEGGGLYLSADPGDSAQYGNQAGAFDTTKDIQMVKSGWLTRPDKTDIVLALRKAGLQAIEENAWTTWFNFINVDALANFRRVDKQMALKIFATQETYKGLIGVVNFDQRIPLKVEDLPPNLLPLVKDLMVGNPISDDQKKMIFQAVRNNMQRLIFMRDILTQQFNNTTLFKAVDAIYSSQFGGVSIADSFNSN